jgi:hemoglobin
MNQNPVARQILTTIAMLAIPLMILGGCGGQDKSADDDFFTSGSREADQRAEQRIAKDQQLEGEGSGGEDTSAANVKPSLFERLGGDQGIKAIVDDFVQRALADPRVNWERKGVEYGGFLGIRDKSAEWKPTPENLDRLKKHLAQFIALATGGPATYEGRDMKEVHHGMKITNVEFDAAVGDLQASLDSLGVPSDEQKELLAIIESTRPQVAEER